MFISISKTAEILGVSENTLRQWDQDGKLKADRTNGGHRRYSIENISNYLSTALDRFYYVKRESEEPDIIELNEKIKTEQQILDILIENCESCYDVPYNKTFTKEQSVWLTKEAWNRCRFKKMVSVQPATGPAALVYFKKEKKNSIIIESEAVAAKSVPYDFKLFSTGNFEELKETYANEMALNLDLFIANRLPKTTILHEMVARNPDKMFDFMKNSGIEYIITSENIADMLNSVPSACDVYTYPQTDQAHNMVSTMGKYPTNSFDSECIFVPYILFIVGMQTIGTCRDAYFRAGWYEV